MLKSLLYRAQSGESSKVLVDSEDWKWDFQTKPRWFSEGFSADPAQDPDSHSCMLSRLLLNHPRRTVFTSTLIASTAAFIKQYPFKLTSTYATVSNTMKITPIPMFSVVPTIFE
jgi:hypothetical protein